jgi:hypothetical protein
MRLKMLGLQDFGDIPLPCAIQGHCIVQMKIKQEEDEWRKRTRKKERGSGVKWA